MGIKTFPFQFRMLQKSGQIGIPTEYLAVLGLEVKNQPTFKVYPDKANGRIIMELLAPPIRKK